MSNEQSGADGLTATERSLGQALAVIHRVLPRLDEPGRAGEVQTALRKALGFLEAARLSHEQSTGARPAMAGEEQRVTTRVAPEIAAVIAAAVSVVLDRPFRLVTVQQVPLPAVPHFNVWAVEGRTQIFQSHKVR